MVESSSWSHRYCVKYVDTGVIDNSALDGEFRRMGEKKQECVQVVVRCRPFSTKEKKESSSDIIEMANELFQVSISNPNKADLPAKNFTFDAVYDETTQQKAFYEESCYDLIEGVMEGYNGTIFAYGQTGCGKTHTMQGYSDPPELRGVIPHSFDHIFENIKGSIGTAYLVRCCYLEIYNEEVRDLLAANGEKKDKLELKEDPTKGVYIKDLTQSIVSDQAGINRLMEQGQKMRTVGATAMNETSSRSHSIFTIVVEMNDVDDAGKDHIRVGKLNLVDLAGSERASKTGATGDRLKEGCKINLSLSALGNVISALVDGKGKHIPYRDSKLTRLLQDSLGGNTKTLMVAAISPADYNYEETLSTLRYANRAKNIKNKPKINEDPKDAILRQYKEEIELLKQQLAQASSLAASNSASLLDAGAGNSTTPALSESDTEPAGENRSSSGHQIENTAKAQILPPTKGGYGVDAGTGKDTEEVLSGQDVREKSAEMTAYLDAGGVGSDSLSSAAPEVAVQEKIVERVVVEEKVVVQEVEVERESQKMSDQRQALENYSRAVEKQRNRLGQELESSALRADMERQAREEMARKLDALQQKVIGLSSSGGETKRRRRRSATNAGEGDAGEGPGGVRGGQSATSAAFPASLAENEDPEVILARRNAEHRRMQAKLRQKRRKETRLELERVRALEEKAEVEKEMADVVGQAEEKERRLNKSRKRLERKLEEAREEIDDLTTEHEREREELLDSIRNQNKELQLWEQVARQILPSKEIARIWERGEYDEDEQAWILPHIKPRVSYAGDTCRLPLIASAPGGGESVDDDTANGENKEWKRGGGQSSVSGIEGSDEDGGIQGGRSGTGGKSSTSKPTSKEDRKRSKRRSVNGRSEGCTSAEMRARRRSVAEEMAPKEGGGGMFNAPEIMWEGGAERRGGSPVPGGGGVWDSSDSPRYSGRYRGFTPPISPAKGRASTSMSASQGQQLQSPPGQRPRSHLAKASTTEVSELTRRPVSRRDSGGSDTWGFSGDVVMRSGGRVGDAGGSRADRCPSRQGGARAGGHSTRAKGEAMVLLTPERSLADPEDLKLRQNATDAHSSVGETPEDSFRRNLGPTEMAFDPGTKRAKSRRSRRSRASIPSMSSEGSDKGHRVVAEAGADCGELGLGTREDIPLADDSSRNKRERARKERRDDRAGHRKETVVGEDGYPSLLDSGLWGSKEAGVLAADEGPVGKGERDKIPVLGLVGDLNGFVGAR